MAPCPACPAMASHNNSKPAMASHGQPWLPAVAKAMGHKDPTPTKTAQRPNTAQDPGPPGHPWAPKTCQICLRITIVGFWSGLHQDDPLFKQLHTQMRIFIKPAQKSIFLKHHGAEMISSRQDCSKMHTPENWMGNWPGNLAGNWHSGHG